MALAMPSAPHRTKTDAALADAESAHQNDPERAEVLARARRFKASWIELAESLSDVRRSGRWRDWGYDSFEAYAKGELHIRQETADKLTGSYGFLKRRAPSGPLAGRPPGADPQLPGGRLPPPGRGQR